MEWIRLILTPNSEYRHKIRKFNIQCGNIRSIFTILTSNNECRRQIRNINIQGRKRSFFTILIWRQIMNVGTKFGNFNVEIKGHFSQFWPQILNVGTKFGILTCKVEIPNLGTKFGNLTFIVEIYGQFS